MSARTGVENSRSGPHLTDRQLQVLRVYAETGSRKLAAEQLGISEYAVASRLARIRCVLGVETTVQAVFVTFAA